MNTKKKNARSTFDSYLFILLIAFEILMSFTFLGYIHVPPVSITFAYMPIIIAACLLGTMESTVMGAVFGLASMYKATAYYVTEADMIFSPFLSGRPAESFILAVVTRTLFRLLIGLAFGALKKRSKKHMKIRIGIVTLIAPGFYAMLVYAAMGIFFPDITRGYMHSVTLNLSAIILSVAGVVIIELIWGLYNQSFLKKFKSAVDNAQKIPYSDSRKKHTIIWLSTFLAFCMTLIAAFYFSQRTSYMLGIHGIAVSPEINNDLTNIHVQFMAAMFSLNIMSIVILILMYQYTSYKNFLGELDTVTGAMGRRLFLNCCERAQKRCDASSVKDGWFLMFDVDKFKLINDTYGHAVGDSVLQEFAVIMKKFFYDCGIVGRLGGDEFAVMIDKQEISQAELEKKLESLSDEIAAIRRDLLEVSCSIGVCHFTFPADMISLMDETDKNLYKAKNNGRSCYVISDYAEKRSADFDKTAGGDFSWEK